MDTRGLDVYDKTLVRIDDKLKNMFEGSKRMIDRMETIGKQMTMKLTVPLTALATVSVMARVKQEEHQKAWGAMLNGMDAGKKKFQELRELSEKTQFNPDQVNEYAQALYRLKIPIDQISPMIKRFSDIAAGTGQDAGALMQQYAEARLNPMMRGMMLQRLMREGAISEADIKRAGISPQLMKSQARLDRLGMGTFDKIFNSMALNNAGKAAQLADTLGKNTENFWESITRVREAIGEVIEKVFHLNRILKAGEKFFKWLADKIEKAPPILKIIAAGVGALLALIGPLILGIAGVAGAIIAARTAVVALQLAGFLAQGQGLLALFPNIIKGILGVRLAAISTMASILWQITLVIGALLAAMFIMRELNIAANNSKKGDASLNDPNNTKALRGVPATVWSPAAFKKQDLATQARQQQMAAFAYSVGSRGPSGSSVIVHVHNPQIAVPAGNSAQQNAALRSGAEALISDSVMNQIHKSVVKSIQKSQRDR